MKQALRLLVIMILFSTTALQCLEDKRSIKISVIKNEFPAESFVYTDVSLSQNNQNQPWVRISPLSSGYSHYFLNGGSVTIYAEVLNEYTRYTKRVIEPSDLIGKQIYIGNNTPRGTRFQEDRGRILYEPDVQLRIDIKWADAPDKAKIRAYKLSDEKDDWTVVITDNYDKPITKKTFKKNTGDLYLQLNSYEIKKTDDPNIVYNANKIKVFKGKDISRTPLFDPKIIKWNEFDSNKSELEISEKEANFVTKGSEKASTIPDKKIRAYKTVEDKIDWTVQITDNSGIEISHSTFKQNTDGFARSLKLRLNPTEITDGSEGQKRYNANKVNVFRGKKAIGNPIFEPTIITASAFAQTPNLELQITDTEATLVPPGSDKNKISSFRALTKSIQQ